MGISAYGAMVQGMAAKKAAKAQKKIMRKEGARKIEQVTANARRNEAENFTRIAKSGVQVTGSPLAVLERNAYQADKQKLLLRQDIDLRSIMLNVQGRNAMMQAKIAAASSVLSDVTSLTSFGLTNFGSGGGGAKK